MEAGALPPPADASDDERYLPDDCFYEIMTHLTPRDIVVTGQACKRLLELSHRDLLWRGTARSALPAPSFRHLSSWVGLPSWKARVAVWARACAAWRCAAGFPAAPAAQDELFPVERGPAIFSAPASQGGPVFCVNALRSANKAAPPREGGRAARDDAPNDDAPQLLCAGADGVVRLLRVAPRAAPLPESEATLRAEAARESACSAPGRAGAWAVWAGGSYARAVREGADAARAASAREATARASFQALRPARSAPHGAHVALAHAWDAHDGGILGMSVADGAEEELRGATAVTCAFSGEATLWRVNSRELDRLAQLPVKRLKALLAAKGLPWADLREKAEFCARIRASNALPAATRLAKLEGHHGTAVSCSHDARLAVTSGHDGMVKIYRLDGAFAREAEREGAAAGGGDGSGAGGSGGGGGGGGSAAAMVVRPSRAIDAHPGGPLNQSGADCVLLEPALGTVASGGKDGVVQVWDIETGAPVSGCTALLHRQALRARKSATHFPPLLPSHTPFP